MNSLGIKCWEAVEADPVAAEAAAVSTDALIMVAALRERNANQRRHDQDGYCPKAPIR
jgi:hypothetical protein